MNSPPTDVDDERIATALDAWGIKVVAIEYQAIGYGSHHWHTVDRDGARHFVSVDELDRKPWLGSNRDVAFAGLRRAFDTALALHDLANLDFVLSPQRTLAGEPLLRLDASHSVAVFPFHPGETGRFGLEMAPEDKARVAGLLADLHRATPAVISIVPPNRADLPERPSLETAIADLQRPWKGGPFTQDARAWLSTNANAVLDLLGLYDKLALNVAAGPDRSVVTHGEPHPGNLMLEDGQLLLIDWDTVRLAPPERDLWMLGAPSDDALLRYSVAADSTVDATALALYRLVWDLNEIAAYIGLFRSVHVTDPDTEVAWRSLVATDLTLDSRRRCAR